VTNNAAILPAISIANANLDEPLAGFAPMNFTVTLSHAPVRPVTVQYATQEQSAISPGDYIPSNGQLTFATGETSKTITIQIQADSSNTEEVETFLVNL